MFSLKKLRFLLELIVGIYSTSTSSLITPLAGVLLITIFHYVLLTATGGLHHLVHCAVAVLGQIPLAELHGQLIYRVALAVEV